MDNKDYAFLIVLLIVGFIASFISFCAGTMNPDPKVFASDSPRFEEFVKRVEFEKSLIKK